MLVLVLGYALVENSFEMIAVAYRTHAVPWYCGGSEKS